ncbi:MAG: hypothetical protein HGA61_03370 [Candidatus Moranbacteria bacterium]|nr:hypothetical protein [Candidatus Moranbacteria bacterium]
MKKISAVFSVVALAFAFSTSFAFAGSSQNNSCCNNHHDNECCPSVTVNNTDNANTTNNVSSSANTGSNRISKASSHGLLSFLSGGSGSASITSGAADSWAHASTTANISTITVSAPAGPATVNNNSSANTTNNVGSRARTGHNSVKGNGNATIISGSALDEASAMTLVNSHVITVN